MSIRNISLNSALNWAVGSGIAEYAIKKKLSAIYNVSGKWPTLCLHALSDYPESLMAGVIAQRYLGPGKAGKGAFLAFAALPLICKLFDHSKMQGTDHFVRIAGKVINFLQSASFTQKLELNAQLLRTVCLALFLIEDLRNTYRFLRCRGPVSYTEWNYFRSEPQPKISTKTRK